MDPIITLATAPAVLGLVTIAKDLGLPTRLAGLLALILGLALAGLDALLAIYTAWAWVSSGLILGLAAAGVYDAAKLVGPATLAAPARWAEATLDETSSEDAA